MKFFKCEIKLDFKNGFAHNSTKDYQVEMPKNAKIIKGSFSSDDKSFLAIHNPQGNSSLEQRPLLLVKITNNLNLNPDLDERNVIKIFHKDSDIFALFECKK